MHFPDQVRNKCACVCACVTHTQVLCNTLLLSQHGWTPLIRASNEGNLKLVKIIADLGANLNDQTNVMSTQFDLL